MTQRDQQLRSTRGGINRLREKGGASPEALYDLLNGYVTADGTIVSRQGTVRHVVLPAGTHGLMSHRGTLHVFADHFIAMPAGVELHLLLHPSDPDAELAKIHYAHPFMGFPYVVAEWSDGAIFHYWLREAETWQAQTEYGFGELVEPTTPSGLVFRATRLGSPNPRWTPRTPREVGDIIEPTTGGRFAYEVTEVAGDNPRSGDVEPDWPQTTGAAITEDEGGLLAAAQATPPEDPDQDALPESLTDRYGGGA